jgi:RNA polymerase sigma-54 factor
MQKLALTQGQALHLAPQQIQQIKLLELAAADIEQRINDELQSNPALEENVVKDEEDNNAKSSSSTTHNDTPAYRLRDNNQPANDDSQLPQNREEYSFYDILRAQLALRPISEWQHEIAMFLIDSMDNDGYLRRPFANIADDIAFADGKMVSEAELEDALRIVQDLEPTGVGARNLRECLLLQLQANEFPSEAALLAQKILEQAFDDFSNKRYDKIYANLNITEAELKAATDEITKLNPKPGAGLGDEPSDSSPAVMPDFIVEYKDGELQQTLTARNAPDLRINPDYLELLRTYAHNRDAATFARQKISDAKWFIGAIKQRYLTLTIVMNAIIARQKEFFITGHESTLVPMVLRDIAQATGYDVTTISRVVGHKHVQTNYGIFPLKFLFSEAAITDSGEEVSTRKVKSAVKEIVDNEDKQHPLDDEKIAQLLKAQGYTTARRTVAKYREMLNIPVARLRMKL